MTTESIARSAAACPTTVRSVRVAGAFVAGVLLAGLRPASLAAQQCPDGGRPPCREVQPARPPVQPADTALKGELRVLAIGEEFTVSQSQNSASTGYVWRVIGLPDILVLVSHGSGPADSRQPPPPGATHLESWRFRAVRAGTGTLQMEYRRPWERDIAPAATLVYAIVVRP